MTFLPVLGGLMPLAVMAGLIWLLVNATGTRRGDPVDLASVVRQVFTYGLLYVALVIAVEGASELVDEALRTGTERSNPALARGLASMLVGLPILALLSRATWRRLQAEPGERRRLGWTAYVDAVLVTSTVMAIVTTHGFVARALGDDGAASFEVGRFVASALWIAVLGSHWWLSLRFGLRGDLERAAGTVIGGATLLVGLFIGLFDTGDAAYGALVDRPALDRGPSTVWWATTAILGAAVWSWYWLRHYRRAERTPLWYVTVVPVATLSGLVMAIVGLALLVDRLGVWFLGDPGRSSAARHFEDGPIFVSLIVVGLATMRYHQWELRRHRGAAQTPRNDPIRANDLLIAAASLVATVVGTVIVLAALFELVSGEPRPSGTANTVIAGATVGVIGASIWVLRWRTIQHHLAIDRDGELGSPLRRIYLFVLFGVGGATALVSLLILASTVFEAALDGVLGRATLDDARVPLALVLTVSGLAWYHFDVYRAERGHVVVPPPPSAADAIPHRCIVVGPRGTEVPLEVVRTGDVVEYWPLVEAGPTSDLLVIMGRGDPITLSIDSGSAAGRS